MNKIKTILILITVFFIFSYDEGAITSAENKNLKSAKEFSLSKLDGSSSVKLSDFKGKPVVINFWSSWCSPCREEMPFLQKTWTEYKEKGVVFIGIDVLDDNKSAREFLKSYDVDYINLSDNDGKISNRYGVIALPATFFIDKNGKITKKNYGPFLGESGEKIFNTYLEEIVN